METRIQSLAGHGEYAGHKVALEQVSLWLSPARYIPQTFHTRLSSGVLQHDPCVPALAEPISSDLLQINIIPCLFPLPVNGTQNVVL
jgi:hypothetical protein